MDLKIRGTRYKVHTPITLIQGKFDKDDIESISVPIINWNEFLSQFFSFPSKRIAIFSHLSDFLTKSQLSWTDFQNQWKQFNELQKKIIEQSVSLQKVIEEENNLDEIAHLSDSIKDLFHQKEDNQRINNENINTSKRELLLKLEKEIQQTKQLLDLQKDEFNVNENRFSQYNTRKTQLEQEMNEFKNIQQNCYKEINKLTAEIDNNEEQLTIYEEKLNPPTLEKEEHERIGVKAKNLTQNLQSLKSQRSQQMQASKQLQIKISENLQNQKVLARNMRDFHPKYIEVKNEYEKQKQQYNIILNQIETIQRDLQLTSAYQIEKQTKISPHNQYTSINQIDQDFSQMQARLQRLQENFPITSEMLMTEIAKKQENNNEIRLQLQKFSENKALLSQIQDIMSNLKKFNQIFNTFLNTIEIECELLITSFSNSMIDFELQMLFQDKKKKLVLLEDLTRQHHAYVIFSLICAFYRSCDLNVIPLYIPLLPEYVTTKKSITKTLEMCQNFIQTQVSDQSLTLIVFDPDSNIELSPHIKI